MIILCDDIPQHVADVLLQPMLMLAKEATDGSECGHNHFAVKRGKVGETEVLVACMLVEGPTHKLLIPFAVSATVGMGLVVDDPEDGHITQLEADADTVAIISRQVLRGEMPGNN